MHYETKGKRFEENNNNNTKTTEKIKRLITYIGLFSTGVIVGILLSKCPKEELALNEMKEKKAYKYHYETQKGTEPEQRKEQQAKIFRETITQNSPENYPEREIQRYIREIYEVPTTQIYYEKTTCPDLPISAELLEKPHQYWNKKEALFKIKLKINTKCFLEGSPIPCTFTAEKVKIEFREDGEKEFKISYGDSPCTKDILRYNFIIDTAPPETKIIPVSFDRVVTTYHSVIFEFTTNEPVKSTLCKIDDGFWMDCSSGRLFPTNIEEGWHKLSVFSVDLAGNKEDPPKEYHFLIDALPPITLLLSAPPSITNSKSAEFIFTSDDEDANFECSINDKEWQKCSSPLILKDLQEGINKIKIRSFDKYGRYEDEPVIYSWRVVSGEIKGNPKPYKPPQDYEEILRRQKRHKKE
jgi:hypothetical protein